MTAGKTLVQMTVTLVVMAVQATDHALDRLSQGLISTLSNDFVLVLLGGLFLTWLVIG